MKSFYRLAGNPRWGFLVMERPVVRSIRKNETRLAGQEVMRHATCTFDSRNRRLRNLFVSAEPLTFPPVRSPGLALRPSKTGFEVFRVSSGTPADRTAYKPVKS